MNNLIDLGVTKVWRQKLEHDYTSDDSMAAGAPCKILSTINGLIHGKFPWETRRDIDTKLKKNRRC